MHERKRDTRPGLAGLTAAAAPAYVANFRFTPQDHPPLTGQARPPAPVPPGTVTSWRVSDVLAGRALDRKYRLAEADKRKRHRDKLPCERTGLANRARLHGLDGERDTAFARVSLHSERAQIKKVRFGYSDRVKVYVNDQLLYGGDHSYRSRDQRFLGTIGLFDE